MVLLPNPYAYPDPDSDPNPDLEPSAITVATTNKKCSTITLVSGESIPNSSKVHIGQVIVKVHETL